MRRPIAMRPRRQVVAEMNAAVDKAREQHVDLRDLSNDLEGVAQNLRMTWATTAPIH